MSKELLQQCVSVDGAGSAAAPRLTAPRRQSAETTGPGEDPGVQVLL